VVEAVYLVLILGRPRDLLDQDREPSASALSRQAAMATLPICCCQKLKP